MTIEETAVAYHEAGHAVAALALGFDIDLLTAESNGVDAGVCRLKDQRRTVTEEVVIDLAGIMAQGRFKGEVGDVDHNGARADYANVIRMVLPVCSTEGQLERYIGHQAERARDLIDANWPAVEAIAAEMLTFRFVSGATAKALFDEKSPGWRRGRERVTRQRVF